MSTVIASEAKQPTRLRPLGLDCFASLATTRALLPLLLALAACCKPAPPAAADPRAEKAAIRQVVADMEAAWNRGDFDAYMAAFKKPDVVFVSKGEVQKDWQATLDHYKRDYGGGGAARRGRLHFWGLRIELLGPDAASLVGRYRLEGGGQPQDGINTRLLRKQGDGRWVIALNHVSSR
ncbi:MAG: YybH family protein [Allosphingosinicella sp.]